MGSGEQGTGNSGFVVGTLVLQSLSEWEMGNGEQWVRSWHFSAAESIRWGNGEQGERAAAGVYISVSQSSTKLYKHWYL